MKHSESGALPDELEVFGDGAQTKSYFYVDDCVGAFLPALDDKFWHGVVEVYNTGSEETPTISHPHVERATAMKRDGCDGVDGIELRSVSQSL